MSEDHGSQHPACGCPPRNVDPDGAVDTAPACQPARTVAPRLTTYLPLVLVVVSLLFLALLPMFIQGRIAASLDELSELTEPARTAVSDMQVAFAQEAAGIPGQHARVQAVTAAMARLEQEIRRDAAARRERILAIHRLDAILSLAGVLLAFGAIMSVARLSMKNRSLAERERSARAATEKACVEVERRRDEIARIIVSRQGLIRGFSHDVKNALGAADGYLFMLERGIMGPLASNQRNAVGHSRHSVRTAMQLIQDLLDLAKDETGDIDLHVVTTDLCEVAVRAVEDYRAQADSKGLAMTIDLPAAFPALQSDPARVGQVLGNLLSNAIKYTEAGSVSVRVGTRQDDTGGEWSVVDVTDTGPGIARDNQRLIFNEFKRLDTSSRTGGTGIGLAISERLAHLLGGYITVDSDLGRGSRFTLWLPLDAAGATNQPATVESAWISVA